MIYSASQFSDRKELDRTLANRVREETDVLRGTIEELSALSLKPGKIVYGVPVQELQ